MQLSLDRREVRLSHALGEFPHTLVELPVGDVVSCQKLGGGAPPKRGQRCNWKLGSSFGGASMKTFDFALEYLT